MSSYESDLGFAMLLADIMDVEEIDIQNKKEEAETEEWELFDEVDMTAPLVPRFCLSCAQCIRCEDGSTVCDDTGHMLGDNSLACEDFV